MKKTLLIAWVGSLIFASGCATKRYVAQQVDPVNGKITDVQKTQEEHERKISATDEKATALIPARRTPLAVQTQLRKRLTG